MSEVENLYNEMSQYITFFKKKYPSIPYDDLEDEINWSFFKTYRAYDPSKGATFKTLFFRVMDNGCKCILRYRDYRKAILDAQSLDFRSDSDSNCDEYYDYIFNGRNLTMEEVIEDGDILDALRSFSSTLPRSTCEVMMLYLDGYSNKEISKMLNKGHNNISTQKAKALRKFVDAYVDEYPSLKDFRFTRRILNN